VTNWANGTERKQSAFGASTKAVMWTHRFEYADVNTPL